MSIIQSAIYNIKTIVIASLISMSLLIFSGCGEFFAEKPTELQAKQILTEASKVKEDPDVANPVPQIYCEEPYVLKSDKGVRLFYFTKNHSPEDLARLAREQLGLQISTSGATNQMIIACASETDVPQILDFLKRIDVLPIQVKIDCIIIEHYADVTMDWETKIQVDNLLGEQINLGGKQQYILDSKGNYIKDAAGNPITDLLPAFPGASLREPKRSTFGLDIGYDNFGTEGHIVKAAVDLLVSRGYLKILMNPSVETVNGKIARISSRDQVPITKIVSGKDTEPYQITEYIWVEDSLSVTPYVYSDGSIGLVTQVKIGSKSTPEGVVQLPIVTERSIDIKENRIKPGRSLVIGGFRKSEKRSVVRGVPFLKDIPFIGVLFSSKDFEDRAKEITFILTPSISSNGMDYDKMVNMVREKQKDPEYCQGLEKVISDPLGTNDYTKQVEKQAAEEEIKRIKAEIEVAETDREAKKARAKLKAYEEKLNLEKQKAQDAADEIEKLQDNLKRLQQQKAKLEDKMKEDADKYQSQKDAALEQVSQEKQKAQQIQAQLKEQVESVNRQSEELQKKLEAAQQEAKAASENAKQAQEEASNLRQQTQELQEQVQQSLQAQAQQAQSQADASTTDEGAQDQSPQQTNNDEPQGTDSSAQ